LSMVEQVAGDEFDPILQMTDAFEINGAAAAHQARHPISLFEQELRQVRAVLACDSRDQRFTLHEQSSLSWTQVLDSTLDYLSRRPPPTAAPALPGSAPTTMRSSANTRYVFHCQIRASGSLPRDRRMLFYGRTS